MTQTRIIKTMLTTVNAEPPVTGSTELGAGKLAMTSALGRMFVTGGVKSSQCLTIF